jgi:hypothetical protein
VRYIVVSQAVLLAGCHHVSTASPWHDAADASADIHVGVLAGFDVGEVDAFARDVCPHQLTGASIPDRALGGANPGIH